MDAGVAPQIARSTDRHLKCYRDGTHRSSDPLETLARVAPLLPVFGITRMANITGLDTVGVPVVMVARPNSRSLSVSQGKGMTLNAAKASGVMEAIESYHAETLDIPTRILDYHELAIHHRIADIDGICLNADKRFHKQAKIPWVRGEELARGGDIWLPYEMVHMDYTNPPCFDSGYFVPSSNGLASGNCRIEAINHALCEVIERDALTLWSLRDQAYRDDYRIKLSSVTDAACKTLIEKFRAAGLVVAIWDITTDIAVPSYLCKISDAQPKADDPRPAMGSGCHPCKAIALSRALTEAAQSRLTFIAGSRDDQPMALYRKYQAADTLSLWLADMQPESETLDFARRAHYEGEFLEEDYRWLLARLAAAGFHQVCMVDLTKPIFDIAVVRVIVPGLEAQSSPASRILKKRGLAIARVGHLQ